MATQNIRFFDIAWDTDGKKVELPREVEMRVEDDEDIDLSLEGADMLSDKFGWCVNSFRFEIVQQTRRQALRAILDEAHTNLKDEDEAEELGFLPTFHEWLDAAKADPYHQFHHDAKEYLALESKASDESAARKRNAAGMSCG